MREAGRQYQLCLNMKIVEYECGSPQEHPS
jgi:hypothetical protein